MVERRQNERDDERITVSLVEKSLHRMPNTGVPRIVSDTLFQMKMSMIASAAAWEYLKKDSPRGFTEMGLDA